MNKIKNPICKPDPEDFRVFRSSSCFDYFKADTRCGSRGYSNSNFSMTYYMGFIICLNKRK